jgi:glycosyltransferase involved in cell wall biosynthesis
VPESLKTNASNLSVIIPMTRMAGRMENLESWLSTSTDLPLNIVIVHDIQDSFTAEELKELVEKYNNLEIEVIEGTYGAPGIARNAGLNNPLANWTCFWDADDLPNPREALEAIAQADAQTEVIIGNFTVNSSQGTKIFEHQSQMEVVALNPGLWRMIIRSSILEGLSFSSARMGEDQLFLIDLNLGSRQVHFSKKFIYQYFLGNPLQLTSNQDSIDEVEDALKLAGKRLRDNKKLKNEFSEIILMRLLTTTLKRTKGSSRIHLIIRHAGIIIHLNPCMVAAYVSSLRKTKAKRK